MMRVQPLIAAYRQTGLLGHFWFSRKLFYLHTFAGHCALCCSIDLFNADIFDALEEQNADVWNLISIQTDLLFCLPQCKYPGICASV